VLHDAVIRYVWQLLRRAKALLESTAGAVAELRPTGVKQLPKLLVAHEGAKDGHGLHGDQFDAAFAI
jgi:hypothetical protein